MSILNSTKLNNLLVNWQPGAVYTSTWLSSQGFSPSAIAGYCQSNWLRSIGRGAFVKVGDTYDWSGSLWAVQQQLGLAIHPGGKTALELDVDALDLGVGNRSIVSGGRLDPKYQITVPANLGLN
jgi:Transcriptional regulator, AbiEi antitoxin N-terminal domain